MTVSVIEKELVDTASFEPRRDYERQDYLAALARAINEVSEDEFDCLSVEAQDWFNEAVRALNKKQDLPEFHDAGAAADEPDEEVDEDETADEPDEKVEELEPEAPEEEKVEEPRPPDQKFAFDKPRKKTKKSAKVEAAKGAIKEVRRHKGQPARKLDHPVIRHPPPDAKPEDLDIVFDEFGLVIGTKNHAAAAMLIEGCRMADVTESIGGTYYNMLRRLVAQGHLLEKNANGMLKLTCKDALTGKPEKKPNKGKK